MQPTRESSVVTSHYDQRAADLNRYMTMPRLWLLIAFSFITTGNLAQETGPTVDPSEAPIYGVIVEAKKNDWNDDWCMVVNYPTVNTLLDGLLHVSTNFLLRTTDTNGVDMSFSLESEMSSDHEGILKAEFCGSREYIGRSEVRIFYASKEFIEDTSSSCLIVGEFSELTIREFGSMLH